MPAGSARLSASADGGSQLPFEVLGKVGPILCWVEGRAGPRLPSAWTTSVDFAQRERDWLLRELPTYSVDNVNEIVSFARASSLRRPRGLRPPSNRPSLTPPRDYDLHSAIDELAQHYFVWNGGEMCIREGRMEELHELALRFPMGHVIRHGHARAVAKGLLRPDEALALPEQMSLLPSNSFGLRTVVRKGLSEGHLHLTGVTSVEEHWADTLLKTFSASGIRGYSAAERRLLTLDLFAGRLLALAVLLAQWDIAHDERPPFTLLALLDNLYFARTELEERHAVEALTRALRRQVGRHESEPDAQTADRGPHDEQGSEVKKDTEGALRQADLWTRLPVELEWLLRWIEPGVHQIRQFLHVARPERSEGLRGRHRLVQRLHLEAHRLLIQLPHRSLHRAFLHDALYRYLICRSHHWQLATQSSRTTGLRHFHHTYYTAHQRSPIGMPDPQYNQLVMDRLREWRGLRVLEGRVAPPRRPDELVPWILGYARYSGEERLRKFGLVLHFKKEDERVEDVSSTRGLLPRLRWGKRRRALRAEARRLHRLLSRPNPVVPFIVGIDAANLELATPPEVFAPSFRFLRDMPIRMRSGPELPSTHLPIQKEIRDLAERRRLGMTYHVGEDFRHLLSGLRAIHEVIEFLGPRPGDRLGHATALALDPSHWARQNGFQAVLPRHEWLDTLVWLHHLLGPGHRLLGELAVEDKIQRLSWQIYSRAYRRDAGSALDGKSEALAKAQHLPKRHHELERDWSPLTLYDAWRLRQLDPYSLDLGQLSVGQLRLKANVGSDSGSRRWHQVQRTMLRSIKETVGSRNAYVLLALYWLNADTRKYGDEIEVVDMRPEKDRWLALCDEVQDRMKEIVHVGELVVEVNPSANRIIGPMADYGEHHVFRLTLDEDNHLSRQVRVSVNTDNPAVCNTSLSHEYYLLGEILMGRGVPEAEVVKWLDWLRENGQEYSFVRRLPDPSELGMKKILDWLGQVRPSVREASTRDQKLQAFWQWYRGLLLPKGHASESDAIVRRLVDRIDQLRAELARTAAMKTNSVMDSRSAPDSRSERRST